MRLNVFLAASLLFTLPACAKSPKRGIAYDLASTADMSALSPGVSWWYDWGAAPNPALPGTAQTTYGMDYLPMLWNFNFDAAQIVAYLQANPQVKYLLVLNEPNVGGQAWLTPQQAAASWPQYEAVALATGVKIVGPQITWGTMANYQDPVAWLDAFFAAYEQAQGHAPQVDYLGFHWYDYGLAAQLNRLEKYKKPLWVTELANWHSGDPVAITKLAEQESQMRKMVSMLEGRADVFRYAWFTGRVSPDPHFSSLLAPAAGTLTGLGVLYLRLPY